MPVILKANKYTTLDYRPLGRQDFWEIKFQSEMSYLERHLDNRSICETLQRGHYHRHGQLPLFPRQGAPRHQREVVLRSVDAIYHLGLQELINGRLTGIWKIIQPLEVSR